MYKNQPLITAQELQEQLNHPNLIILDASKTKTQPKIVGARYFDLKNNFSDQECPFPNTFPSVKQFEQEAQKLGICQDSRLVVYDDQGIYMSPRVWWMFRVMGHQNVFVLDGGLPGWIAQGGETTATLTEPPLGGDFQAKLDPCQIKDLEAISHLSKEELLIDVRSSDRFHARVPEPRAGLRSGHIPGSINIPFQEVLSGGYYKSKGALAKVFRDAGVAEYSLVFSCGSGVTACIVYLAACLVLKNDLAIYDGSWTEYASVIEP